jgi:hypothetical protein
VTGHSGFIPFCDGVVVPSRFGVSFVASEFVGGPVRYGSARGWTVMSGTFERYGISGLTHCWMRSDLSRRGFHACCGLLLAASKWLLTLDKAFVAVVRFGCHIARLKDVNFKIR